MKTTLFIIKQILFSFSLLSPLWAMEQPSKPGQKLLISRAQRDDASAQLQLAQDYLDQGNLQEAQYWALKVISSSDEKDDTFTQGAALSYFIEGKVLEQKGTLKAAKEKYVLAAHRGSWQAQNKLGELAAQEKNFEEAKKWYTLALPSNQDIVYNNLGKLAEESNNNREARKWYQKSGNTNALALLHKKEDNRAEAKRLLSVAANINCGYAYYHLGLMEFEENSLEKAEYNLKKALTAKVCPDEPNYLGDTYYLLSRVQEKLKKPSEAEEALSKAVTDYHDIKAAHRLGNIYFKQGKTEQAKEMFLQAAKQNFRPSLFNLGAIAEREKDVTVAKKYYTQASQLEFGRAKQRLRFLIERDVKKMRAKQAQEEQKSSL